MIATFHDVFYREALAPMSAPPMQKAPDGGFAKGEYTCAFRLTSKLVDLQAWYVHPYSRRNACANIARLEC